MSDLANNAAAAIPSMPSGDDVKQGISNAASTMRNSVSSAVSGFSSANVMNASNEFLATNGMLAKFVFIVMVVIAFLVLMKIGTALVNALVGPNRSPYLLDGLQNGTQPTTVSQDPANSESLIVYRSNNQNGGMEFTWSVWLQMLAMPATDKYHSIFVKGSASESTMYAPSTDSTNYGLVKVNNGPGLYTRASATSDSSNNTCNLKFIMNVVSPSDSSGVGQTPDVVLDTPNFPVGQWTHVAYRLQNKMLDCYVNGTIFSRKSFGDNIPKQNYDNVYLCGNGGFPGNMSNLRYYDYALSVFEINSVVYYGPNMKASAKNNNSDYHFLGQTWFSKYDGSN